MKKVTTYTVCDARDCAEQDTTAFEIRTNKSRKTVDLCAEHGNLIRQAMGLPVRPLRGSVIEDVEPKAEAPKRTRKPRAKAVAA